MKKNMLRHNTWPYLALLAILFSLQFLFVSPIGEFALNDDWVHTWTAMNLAETGEFTLMPWAGPTFYVPILYGTVLIKVFGFSFSLLRLSTLAITFALLVTFFLFTKKLTNNAPLSLLTTLILWLNPIVYNLSFTFMTDIPALFLLLLSLVAYHQAIHKKIHGGKKMALWFFTGTLLCVLGFYTRQTNILLVTPFGLYALFQTKNLRGIFLVLTSFGIPLLIGGLVYAWLHLHNMLPPAAGATHFLNEGLLRHAGLWLWQHALLLGFFTLPLTLGWVAKHWKKITTTSALLSTLFTLLSIFLHHTFSDRLFHVGNIITPYGLGPSAVIQGIHTVLMSPTWQFIFTAASAAGLSILAIMWIQTKRYIQGQSAKKTIQLALWFCALYGILIVSIFGFDRYVLPVLMIVLIALAYRCRNATLSYTTIAMSVVIMGSFSLTQTHHYLTWNAARWELGHTALEQPAEPHDIDGGYEWSGWHSYWSAVAEKQAYGPEGSPWWIRGLLTNNTEEYVISFSTLADYEIVEKKDIRSSNPHAHILLLKKEGK